MQKKENFSRNAVGFRLSGITMERQVETPVQHEVAPDVQRMGVAIIRQNHAQNRPALVEKMYNKSFKGVIDDFFVELEAKNKAYYFIMEMGLLGEFRDYCAQ